jgi:molecular chaperone GrpE
MMDEMNNETIIDRFREWLQQVHGEANEVPAESAAADDFGLYRFAEEFTALRHELKLQTRAGRSLEERTDTLLTAVGEVIELVKSRPQGTTASAAPPKLFANTLADLDEALERGRDQLEKSITRLVDSPVESLMVSIDGLQSQQGWFRRWLTAGFHQRVQQCIPKALEASRTEQRKVLSALLDGYELIHQRLRRAMADEGIVRIQTIGAVVDPELMVVVELVDGEGAAGTVADEIRRGYTWKGAVLRYANVRAIRANTERKSD